MVKYSLKICNGVVKMQNSENSKESKNKISIYEQEYIEMLFCNSNHELPLHSHESWCIGVVTEGEVLFKIKDQESSLKRGMLFLIPSNTGVKITPVKKYKYITICIKENLRKPFFELVFDQYFLKLNDMDDFLDICHDFMWNRNTDKLISDLVELVKPLLCVDSLKKHHKVSEPIQKAITYLKSHANEKFDLDVLSEAAYISKYHLVRQFKKEMGVSPHQYYIQTKIRIAKANILENKSEIEIATELNYADQSHLCRQFKQMMGISLQDYKKNIRKK